MPLLVLKLILTPLLMLSLTLAGRRWGQTVSGIFAGLPLNSGPISFLFALQYGTTFAAEAAVGSMGGMIAVGAFAIVYATLTRRFGWIICVTLAEAAYFAVIYALNVLSLPLTATLVLTVSILLLFLWRMPPRAPAVFAPELGKWDLPARIVVATLFVLIITALGDILGPQLGGLISTFPIFATVLAVFTHRQLGASAAAQWLRGTIVGMFSTVAFYVVVGYLVTTLPIYLTYSLAVLAALSTSAINLILLRREPSTSAQETKTPSTFGRESKG